MSVGPNCSEAVGKRNVRQNETHQANPHVLLVPFPFQGHIVPFTKLGHQLARHGCKVTVFTTENRRTQMEIVASLKLDGKEQEQEQVKIISVPDEQKDDVHSFLRVMPCQLENLIKKTNEEEIYEKITCVIAEFGFDWALEIAKKMGLKHAIFFPSAPGVLAMVLRIPKLIEAGIIDADNGTMKRDEKIDLSPNSPALNEADFVWNRPGDQFMQKTAFQYLLLANKNFNIAKWILCNWFHELDPSANDLLENIISVGPLLANGQSIGNVWSEDLTCLPWLDRQSPGSVIYVAFGSSSKFSQQQFEELASGLELLGKPFLWVVRSNTTDAVSTQYPDGFLEKVTHLGKIVQWAPQEKVLAHPSIACYLTHSGWNSTLESITMGVPMLCLPYFADQFFIKSCVCCGWKIGLELNPDANGIMITRHEIKRKVEELLSNESIKENVRKLKELAQMNANGGGSSKNLESFVAQLMV